MKRALTDVLRDLHIPYREHGQHHHTRQGWVQIDCPYCGRGSKGWHCGISIHDGRASCWRCGGKNINDILSRTSGVPNGAVKAALSAVKFLKVRRRKHTGIYKPPPDLGPLRRGHRRYLEGRGFDPDELVERWHLQGTGELAGELRWRVFIPIEEYGKPVSWTTRSVSNSSGLRYRSASEQDEAVRHKEILYGADYASHAVVVVEGPVDVWAIGPGAVCTCGIGYSPEQLEALAKYSVRAICFDDEPLAQKRARQLLHALAGWPGENYLIRLHGNDPATAPKEDLVAIRRDVLGYGYAV